MTKSDVNARQLNNSNRHALRIRSSIASFLPSIFLEKSYHIISDTQRCIYKNVSTTTIHVSSSKFVTLDFVLFLFVVLSNDVTFVNRHRLRHF